MKPKPSAQRIGGPGHLAVPALLLLAALFAGCSSGSDPRSSSMASVLLRTATTDQVRKTVQDVFTENLYRTGLAPSPEKLVFERPGSTMDEVKYGGFFEGNIWVRVKVTISRFGDTDHLVEADAYIVRHYGEGFFEEEQRLFKFSKGTYQKMLNEVEKRLTP